MPKPTALNGTLNNGNQTGVRADGLEASYLYWGTTGLLESPTVAGNQGNYAVILNFEQAPESDNVKLPSGSGMTSTRVQVVDGAVWNLTLRDDSRLSALPNIGTKVMVVDMLGMFGSVGSPIAARVIESPWSSAPKQAGERRITVEKLALITET